MLFSVVFSCNFVQTTAACSTQTTAVCSARTTSEYSAQIIAICFKRRLFRLNNRLVPVTSGCPAQTARSWSVPMTAVSFRQQHPVPSKRQLFLSGNSRLFCSSDGLLSAQTTETLPLEYLVATSAVSSGQVGRQ